MESVLKAVEGKMDPSDEDKAAAAMKDKAASGGNVLKPRRSLKDLEGHKKVVVRKAWGILGLTVSDSKRNDGVFVVKMAAGSQLDHAGLNVGDTILTLNGRSIEDNASCVKELNEAKPDEDITLTMAVHTHKIRVDKTAGPVGLSLANNPSGVGVTVCGLGEKSAAAEAGMEINDEVLAINGLAVNEHSTAVTIINESQRWVDLVLVGSDPWEGAMRRAMIVKPKEGCTEGWATEQLKCDPCNEKGVLVTEVVPDSVAADVGIKPDDIIYSINNVPVASMDEVVEQLNVSTGRAHFVLSK
jgi:S1-C subfamily serine protease